MANLQSQVPGASSNRKSENVRLSVTQALWFPILRNFTDLFKEKDQDVSDRAIESFSNVLLDNYQVFGEDLWRELFG